MRRQGAAHQLGTGGGRIEGDSGILPFRRRARECDDCAIRLPTDSPPYYTICRCCWHWRRIGRGVALLTHSLREVRR